MEFNSFKKEKEKFTFSELESSAEVASSRSSMGGLRIQVRAMAILEEKEK